MARGARGQAARICPCSDFCLPNPSARPSPAAATAWRCLRASGLVVCSGQLGIRARTIRGFPTSAGAQAEAVLQQHCRRARASKPRPPRHRAHQHVRFRPRLREALWRCATGCFRPAPASTLLIVSGAFRGPEFKIEMGRSRPVETAACVKGQAESNGAERVWWGDYRTTEYAAIDPSVAVLPVARRRQHGRTARLRDTASGHSMLEAVMRRLPGLTSTCASLPVQAIEPSRTSTSCAGARSPLPPATLIEAARPSSAFRGPLYRRGEDRRRQLAWRRQGRHRHPRAACAPKCWRSRRAGGTSGRPEGHVHGREDRLGIHGGDVGDLADAAALPARSGRHGQGAELRLQHRPGRQAFRPAAPDRRTPSPGSPATSTSTAWPAFLHRHGREGRLTAEHQSRRLRCGCRRTCARRLADLAGLTRLTPAA